MRVSIAQAKNRLSQLIQQAEKRELVTICRYGKPVVDLVRRGVVEGKPRQFGTLGDRITILDRDWATPQNDIDKWLHGDV